MKITTFDRKIEEIFVSGFYTIPRFQRPYSWKKEHVEELCNDTIIEREIKDDYFIGSIVVFKNPEGQSAIVDGQQRITTITMLLCALRNLFQFEGFNDLAIGIHNLVEKPDIDNNMQFVLKTETSYPYLQENIQKFGDSEYSGPIGDDEKNLKTAYEYIVEFLDDVLGPIRSDSSLDEKTRKREIKQKAIEVRDKLLSLKTIYVTLDNEDDAYTVFETLNTRGENLRVADLVKNYLSRNIKQTNKNVDIARDKWEEILQVIEGSAENIPLDSFIHHFWLSKYQYTSQKKLFKLLRKQVKNKEDAKNILDALLADSSTYRGINETSYRKWGKHELAIRASLDAFQVLKIKQQMPMVLSVMREYETGDLKLKHMKEILSAIENFHFVFTGVTSQRSSGGISSMYASSARRLWSAHSVDEKIRILRELKAKLIEKLPSYLEFEANFMEIRYSKKYTLQKALVQYILGKFTTHFQKGIPFDLEQMTIEHLASENPSGSANVTDEHIAMLGNLLLVNEEANKKLGNKEISKKIEVLKNSHVHLDSVIKKAKIWDNSKIEERTRMLSKLAYNEIWKL